VELANGVLNVRKGNKFVKLKYAEQRKYPLGKQIERSGKSHEETQGKDVNLLNITFWTLFVGLGHLIY
jgi:hypothetical protein